MAGLPAFPAAGEHPLDTCLRLQQSAPVVQVEFPGGVPAYLALTNQAVREVLAGDNKTFVRSPQAWPALHDGSIPADWPFRAVFEGDHLSTKDGADHRRLRGLVGKGFTPARVAALEPRIQEIIDELLDQVAAAGDGADLVPLFCDSLPLNVISELFGIPPHERAPIRKWVLATLAHTTTPEEAVATQTAFRGYLHELVERKQAAPADDLVTALVRARDDDDRLTTDEIVATLWAMTIAGHETTVYLLGNAVVALSQNPDQRKQAEVEGRWADVVEEALRWRHAVTMAPFRISTEDVVIAGVPIPAGSAVGVSFQASGIDNGAYVDARSFDLTREHGQSLAFGHGPRFCIGAPLARLEGRLGLSALYRRFPELELAIDVAEIPEPPSFFTNGPLSLPVHLGATPK